MSNTPIEDKLILDDSYDAEPAASPAPSRWARVAVATAGAAVVLSRLAGVAHADDGADDDHDFMFATHKDGAIHDDSDTVRSADSPMSVKSTMTVKSPDSISVATLDTASPASVNAVSPTESPSVATVQSLDTPDSPTATASATATGDTTLGLGPLVSQFASGRFTAAQESALAPLLKGGLTAADLHQMSVSEFVSSLKAAGLSPAQIETVLKS